MKKTVTKIAIIAAVMLLVAGATITKKNREVNTESRSSAKEVPIKAVEKTKRLPKLIDLGAGKCIPCKMMAPILEELKKEYVGVFEVEFIDVWENPDVAKKYGIQMIPTQIFYDSEGKELYRHVGFFSKEEILNTWKKYGVEVTKGK